MRFNLKWILCSLISLPCLLPASTQTFLVISKFKLAAHQSQSVSARVHHACQCDILQTATMVQIILAVWAIWPYSCVCCVWDESADMFHLSIMLMRRVVCTEKVSQGEFTRCQQHAINNPECNLGSYAKPVIEITHSELGNWPSAVNLNVC